MKLRKICFLFIVLISLPLFALKAKESEDFPTDEILSDRNDTIELQQFGITVIKQNTNLKNLPIASSVISEGEAERMDIVSIKGVSDIVPNLLIPDYGSRITSSIYMRGLGARMDQPVIGLSVDNVPILNKDAYDFDLADIYSIQILRGPQSTLYGRNTMGGQMNISTLSPLNYQGLRISAQYSSGNTIRGNISGYYKINPDMGVSISAGYLHSDGFFKNTFNNEKTDKQNLFNSRLKYEWKIRENLALINTFSLSHLQQGGYPYENIESGKIAYNDTCFYKRLLITDGLTIRWNAEPFVFNSITSFQYIDDNMTLDQDFLPKDYFTLTQKKKEPAFTQDFIFRNKDNGNRYSWLAGLFGFYKHTDMLAPVTFKNYGISELIEYHRNDANPDHPIKWDSRTFPLNSEFKIPTFGVALYHESKYSLDKWDFTLGLRADFERTSMTYRSSCNTGYTIYNLMPDGSLEFARHGDLIIDETGLLHRSFFTLMPKLAVLYRLPLNSSNIYLNISRGYKAGGYNTQMFSDILKQKLMGLMGIGGNLDVDEAAGYEPESSWNYELGSHLSWLNGRLNTDLTIFYIDCRDQQLTVFPPGLTTGRMMTNAGKTRSFGVEFTASVFPIEGLKFTFSYGYTNAKFRKYNDGKNDFSGKYIPYAPQNTLFIEGTYDLRLNRKFLSAILFDLNLRGVGKIYWNESNTVSQPFYLLPGASVTFETKNVSLQLWGRNLSSTKYYTFYFVSMENEFRQKGRPAEIGVTLRINI